MSGSIRKFAGFVYNPQTGLQKDGVPIHLGPQARQLLELLLDANGAVVSKAEIASRLWPERPPSDDSIDRCAYLLRRPLRDAGFGDLIATYYGRGLSLRARVETVALDGSAPCGERAAPSARIFDLYRTAYELAGSRKRDGFERAEAAIEAAMPRDPDSPAIWSLSADLAVSRVLYGLMPPERAVTQIERTAGRALELAPDYAAALASLGWARAALRRLPEEGLAMLDRAVAQDPHYGTARVYRSWALAAQDRLEEAIEEIEAGLRASPLDQFPLGVRAWLRMCAGDLDGGGEQARRGLEIRPDGGWLWAVAAITASLRDRHDEAIEAARKGLDVLRDDPTLLAVLSYVLAAAGQKDEADGALVAASADDEVSPPPLFEAAAMLALGRRADAVEALARGRDMGCPWFVFFGHDPRLAPLRDDIARIRAAAGG